MLWCLRSVRRDISYCIISTWFGCPQDQWVWVNCHKYFPKKLYIWRSTPSSTWCSKWKLISNTLPWSKSNSELTLCPMYITVMFGVSLRSGLSCSPESYEYRATSRRNFKVWNWKSLFLNCLIFKFVWNTSSDWQISVFICNMFLFPN